MKTPRLVSLIVLCYFTSGTLGASCPYQDPHCTCVDTNVTCLGFDTFPQPVVGWNSSSIQNAIFVPGKNLIVKIPDNSFPPGLVSINITGNVTLNFLISDNAFMPTVNSLEVLFISNAGYAPLPAAILSLVKLKNLTISGDYFKDWYNDTERIDRWLELIFLNLQFTFLETFSFDYLPMNLETLWLTFNRINVTKYTSGSSLPPLKDLRMEGNDLTSIPNVLANLSKLTFLDLSLNKITQINLDDFPENLNWLDLSFNQISRINGSVIEVFSKLSVLFLMNNPIVFIADTAFINLGHLSLLDLTETELTRLPLALTSLATTGNFLMLLLDPSVNLSCPCPPPNELVRWFKATNTRVNILGRCPEGEYIKDYLASWCNSTIEHPKASVLDKSSTTFTSHLNVKENNQKLSFLATGRVNKKSGTGEKQRRKMYNFH